MIRKILIVEDNEAHMNVMRTIVEELHQEIQLYCASNVGQAFQIALEQHIHLFLVDIILDMKKPGDTAGLNFAREIREISKYKFTPLVFITSLEDPKLYSYSQLHCFGYIEKPFSVAQVKKTILSALEFPIKEDYERYVYFRKDKIVYSVQISDIVYIEISRRKVNIHCTYDELEIPYITCEEILQQLDSDDFIQCSRYCIVNRKYIEHIDYTNRYVKMKHTERPVEIGVIMKKEFKKRVENE